MTGSDMGVQEVTPFHPTGEWNMLQFTLICSYTLGLTAMCKFPYLVYRHTGLFLVAYYVLLLLVCVPLTFLQLKLGGLFRRGIVSIFRHYLPAIKGVAVGLLLISFIQCIFQNVPVSYSLYYMCTSWYQPFIWERAHANDTSRQMSSSYVYLTKTPAEHYFYNEFLQRSGSLLTPGVVPWYLCITLFITWLVTYLFIARGAPWFGKVMYISCPIALSSMIAVLVYSHVTIPSSYNSLVHLYGTTRQSEDDVPSHKSLLETVDILSSELASPLTWIKALEQHIFSLGLWAGILPTLGAHLTTKKPSTNLTWATLLLVHSILPHLSTIAIAPFVHALAVHKNQQFENIISSGPHLLFVVLPEAFTVTQAHPVFVVLFYTMLFLCAVHQQAIVMLVLGECLSEGLPVYSKLVFKRFEYLLAALCGAAFLLGLPHICQGGQYLTQLVELSTYRIWPLAMLCMIIPFAVGYARMEEFHMPVERICMSLWFALATFTSCLLLCYNQVIFVCEYIRSLSLDNFSITLGFGVAVLPLFGCMVIGLIHEVILSEEESVLERFRSVFRLTTAPPVANLCEYTDDDAVFESSTLKFRKQIAKQAADACAAAVSADLEVCVNSGETGDVVPL